MTEHHPHLHIPEKRQSIAPTRAVWLAFAGIGAVLLVIWLVLAAAVGSGDDECAAKGNQTSANCR